MSEEDKIEEIKRIREQIIDSMKRGEPVKKRRKLLERYKVLTETKN